MSEVTASASPPSYAEQTGIFQAEVVITAESKAKGELIMGGMSMTPEQAAGWVMTIRSATMKDSAVKRISQAEQNVHFLKMARQLKAHVTQTERLLGEDRGYRIGPWEKAVLTPEQVRFLNDTVGRPTIMEDNVTLLIDAYRIGELPPTLLDATGLKFRQGISDEFTGGDRSDLTLLDISATGGPSDEYMDGVRRDRDRLNYYQDGDRYTPQPPILMGMKGTTATGKSWETTQGENGYTQYVRVDMGQGAYLHKNNFEGIQEDMNHFIEQTGNDNSLVTSKLKNQTSIANNAAEAANSFLNKQNEKANKMISNFR